MYYMFQVNLPDMLFLALHLFTSTFHGRILSQIPKCLQNDCVTLSPSSLSSTPAVWSRHPASMPTNSPNWSRETTATPRREANQREVDNAFAEPKLSGCGVSGQKQLFSLERGTPRGLVSTAAAGQSPSVPVSHKGNGRFSSPTCPLDGAAVLT